MKSIISAFAVFLLLITVLYRLVITIDSTELYLPSANATFPIIDSKLAKLGQLLFYDPILSGNRTVSCATCHHPKFATTDGVSLGIGDGGIGLGNDRVINNHNSPERLIARNSISLFNLGATEFTVMFFDGRLEHHPDFTNQTRTPLGIEMVSGFDSILAAQTMFPVLSADEMAGHYSENEISTAVRIGNLSHIGGAWAMLALRVASINGYKKRFQELGINNIHFVDISNAIAAFIAKEWRADNSKFDKYIRGETELTDMEKKGLNIFYGKAGCSSCHSGQFQTDHDFHAIAMPQIGPGKATRFEKHKQDKGRMRVTGNSNDAYKFRTPSLRNVLHTSPYGHSGAFSSLRDVIIHHINPEKSLRSYDISMATFPKTIDDLVFDVNTDEIAAILQANELLPQVLNDTEINYLMSFLTTLDDDESLRGRLKIPKNVPSGLPVIQ